jgi:hypothetical protein
LTQEQIQRTPAELAPVLGYDRRAATETEAQSVAGTFTTFRFETPLVAQLDADFPEGQGLVGREFPG